MTNKNDQENSKKKKWLIILLLLFLLLGGYGAYRYLNQPKTEDMSIVSGEFLPDGKDARKMSDEELAKAAQKAVDKSNFNMMISPTATVNGKTQKGKLSIKNPKTNSYPINVELKDDKTGELLYTSGAINPGEEVTDIELEKPLSKGTFMTTALFSLYDPATKAKKGEVSAGVDLTVN